MENIYVPSPVIVVTNVSGLASFTPTAAPPFQPSEPPPLVISVPGFVRPA